MRLILSAGLLLIATLLAIDPGLRAQISEEEQRKRDLFLRSREDIRPVPRPSPTPARPVPRPTAKPSTPTPTPRPTATPPVATSTPQPASTPAPRSTAAPASSTPSPTTTPRSTAKPSATPTAKAKPSLQPKSKPTPDAPIHIEKSGVQADEGVVPPPKSGGLFGTRYRYLTPAVRRAIDSAPVKRGRWKYIIIHNSGTRQGNAKAFDNYHKKVRKMQNGMAYHFVIGNGTSSGNGEIEIGNRWVRQINGGHVASDYLNNIAVGICLVGDFNRDVPNKAQMLALDELIAYLRGRVGKIKGKNSIVRGHKQINPKPTDCPGNRFDLKWLNQRFKD